MFCDILLKPIWTNRQLYRNTSCRIRNRFLFFSRPKQNMCISIVKTEQRASPLISQNGVIYTKIRACVCVWGYTAYKFDFTRARVCVWISKSESRA